MAGKFNLKPVGLKMARALRAFNSSKNSPTRQRLLREPAHSVSPDNYTVYTKQGDALRAAIKLIGVASERNPEGLDISLEVAKYIWFGNDKATKISDVEEAEFRALVETGDNNFDKSRMRRFVNMDGSTSYEIANKDKSIASKFTVGNFHNRKIFTQGDYSNYAQALRDFEEMDKASPGPGGQFDRMNKKATGEI